MPLQPTPTWRSCRNLISSHSPSTIQYKWTLILQQEDKKMDLTWPSWILSLDLTPRPSQYFHSQLLFRDTPNNPCNPCKLTDYSGSSFTSPWFFSYLGFHVKIMYLCLFFCIVIIVLHLHTRPLSRLWCGSTIWSFALENLHHKLVLLLRSEFLHSRFIH